MMYKRGLWIDDVREPPERFYYMGKPVHWERAWDVEGAKRAISEHEQYDYRYDLLSVDHDAGDFVCDGGDYIKLLDWLEETERNYPIRIHSANVVGRQNMEAICRRNGWKIVY